MTLNSLTFSVHLSKLVVSSHPFGCTCLVLKSTDDVDCSVVCGQFLLVVSIGCTEADYNRSPEC